MSVVEGLHKLHDFAPSIDFLVFDAFVIVETSEEPQQHSQKSSDFRFPLNHWYLNIVPVWSRVGSSVPTAAVSLSALVSGLQSLPPVPFFSSFRPHCNMLRAVQDPGQARTPPRGRRGEGNQPPASLYNTHRLCLMVVRTRGGRGGGRRKEDRGKS